MIGFYSFLLFGSVVSQSQEAECENNLITWAKTLIVPVQKADENYSKMVRYSGRSINDLGLYYECLGIPSANYVIFEIQESPAVVIGLCLPKTCTIQDYQRILYGKDTFGLKFWLNKQIEFYHTNNLIDYSNTRRLLNIPITKIVFPNDFTNNTDNLSASAIGMIVFLVFLLLIAVIATIFEVNHITRGSFNIFPFYLRRKPKENHAINSDAEDPELTSFVESLEVKKLSKIGKVLWSFSLYSNVKKVFNVEYEDKKDCLHNLNVIKVLSIAWVCFGHTEIFRIEDSVVVNIEEVDLALSHLYFALVYSAPYAVDSLFWVSGFLQSYLLTSALRTKKNTNFFYLFLKRILRILPLYVSVLLISWSLAKFIGNGPKWYNAEDFMHSNCKEYFWTNILFINNFVYPSNSRNCLVGSWYFANDIQFFIISVPIIYLYTNYSSIYGWSLCIASVFISIVSAGAISYDEHFKDNLLAQNDLRYLHDLYYKPYCRIAPYVIGMIGGFAYYNFVNKNKENFESFDCFSLKIIDWFKIRWIRYIGYIIGFSLINVMIWVQYEAYQSFNEWNRLQNSVFFSLQRTCWGISLSLLFLPLMFGHMSVLKPFLQWNMWIPASRLVFGVYLVHMVIGQIYFFSQPVAYYFNQANLIMDSLFLLVLSYFFVIPLVLLIECPAKNLKKLVFAN